jgi:hypothetical protein
VGSPTCTSHRLKRSILSLIYAARLSRATYSGRSSAASGPREFALALSRRSYRDSVGQVRSVCARSVSGSVARGSDRVSTRKSPRPDRISNYRDTAMRNISRMRARQGDIDKTFVVTSGSSHRPGDTLSSTVRVSFLSLALPPSRPPHRSCLIDATRFLRVITAALEPDRFNLPAAI